MGFGAIKDSVNEDFRQYKRMRKLGRSLNSKLVETLSRKDLMAGAKKLGLARKGVLVAGSEEELDVLMDYCLYSVLRGGMNTVQRYLKKASVAEDELPLLEAMSMAWYSVFQILEIGSGYIIFRDVFTSKEYRVMDKNLSQSAVVGLMFAVRLIPCGGWNMTSGAGIPIVRETLDVIEPVLAKFDGLSRDDGLEKPFSSAREANFAAQVIRELLRADAMEKIRHEF